MIINSFVSLLKDESGATAIEYGLIAALVSVAAIVALGDLGRALDLIFGTVSGEMNIAASSAAGSATGTTTP